MIISILDIYEYVDIEKRQDCIQLENYFQYICYTDRRQVLRKDFDKQKTGFSCFLESIYFHRSTIFWFFL
jgi:hypothetical protein